MYLAGTNRRRNHVVLAAAISLLAGCIYYLYFRIQPIGSPNDPTNGSLPSLIHMLVLTWMAFALTGVKRGLWISTGILILSLSAEWLVGHTSLTDTAMLVAGFAIAAITATSHLQSVSASAFPANTTLSGGGLVLCSIVFITGTSPLCNGTDCETTNFRDANPVYMDYATLRSAVQVTDAKPLTDVSRVYIYQNAVLLNSRNQGIHVLDNTDPANPRNVAFIEIPGNTEISIRDNNLYVDSYIDLVTLNISDANNVTEVAREQDIFEYDAYQNVPDDIYLGVIDESRGVVVDYELTN